MMTNVVLRAKYVGVVEGELVGYTQDELYLKDVKVGTFTFKTIAEMTIKKKDVISFDAHIERKLDKFSQEELHKLLKIKDFRAKERVQELYKENETNTKTVEKEDHVTVPVQEVTSVEKEVEKMEDLKKQELESLKANVTKAKESSSMWNFVTSFLVNKKEVAKKAEETPKKEVVKEEAKKPTKFDNKFGGRVQTAHTKFETLPEMIRHIKSNFKRKREPVKSLEPWGTTFESGSTTFRSRKEKHDRFSS